MAFVSQPNSSLTPRATYFLMASEASNDLSPLRNFVSTKSSPTVCTKRSGTKKRSCDKYEIATRQPHPNLGRDLGPPPLGQRLTLPFDLDDWRDDGHVDEGRFRRHLRHHVHLHLLRRCLQRVIICRLRRRKLVAFVHLVEYVEHLL